MKAPQASSNSNLIYANFNPWGRKISDCAIRAISAATGLKYQEVCKRLGHSWKNGYGLIRDTGVSLDHIKDVFDEYFDVVEDFYDNNEFVPDEFKGSKEQQEMDDFDLENNINGISGITLDEFVKLFKNQGTFLVSVDGNPEAKRKASRTGGHIVCVKCNPKFKQGFIDFWDSGEMLVSAYMRLDKTEPSNSPLHWRYDFEKHKLIP